MLNDADPTRFDAVVLKTGYTDMRRGIDGLVAIIQNNIQLDPFTNTLFLFCGRRTDRIKAIVYEGDGFLLMYKRLACARFQWPRTPEEVKALTPQQFRWLMEGLSIEQKKVVKPFRPERV